MGLVQALPTIRIISFRLIPQIFVLLRSFYFDQYVFAQPQNRLHKQCIPPPDDPNDFNRGKIYPHLKNVYRLYLRGIHNNSYQWYDLCFSASNGCCKNLKVDGCLANDYVHALGSYTTRKILTPTGDGVERYHYSNYNNENYITYEDDDLDSNGDWIVIWFTIFFIQNLHKSSSILDVIWH